MTRLAPRPTADAAASPHPPLPRRDPITDLPIVVLYPHSRCNCRCVMCDIWKARERLEIGAGEVRGWIEEWRSVGVRRVVLSGGEPLMHANLWQLCAVLRDAGFGITILSTGLLLRRVAAELVRHCDDVVVSLDGPAAVHDEIRRVPSAYERLAAGVGAVKAADPGVRVTARCTVQKSNFRFLRATVSAARAAGVDRLSFLAADVDSDAFNRPGGWDHARAGEVALSESELAELAAELAALAREHRDDFETGFIAESPGKLRDRLYGHFAALLGQGEAPPRHCNAPWVSTVIEADGTVRPCFFQPPLGNIREAGSLLGVLNAPAAVAWRRNLDTGSDPICRRCVCSLSLRAGDADMEAARG